MVCLSADPGGHSRCPQWPHRASVRRWAYFGGGVAGTESPIWPGNGPGGRPPSPSSRGSRIRRPQAAQLRDCPQRRWKNHRRPR